MRLGGRKANRHNLPARVATIIYDPGHVTRPDRPVGHWRERPAGVLTSIHRGEMRAASRRVAQAFAIASGGLR